MNDQQTIDNIFYARIGRIITSVIGVISLAAFAGVLAIRDTTNANANKSVALEQRIELLEKDRDAMSGIRDRLGSIDGALKNIDYRLGRLEGSTR